jgi:signal transduction histidine kinase
LGLAAVTLLAVLTTGYIALWAAGDSLRVRREADVVLAASSAARAVATLFAGDEALKSHHTIDGRERLNALLRGLVQVDPGLELSILGAKREIVAAWPPRPTDDRDLPVANGVLAGAPPVLNYRADPEHGGKELVAYAGIEADGRVRGVARAVLPADVPVHVVLRRSGVLLLVLALTNAALVLALGYFVLTQLVVRPLRRLERATTQVTEGHWEGPIEQAGPSELANLVDSFNQMIVSLASQREQLIRSEKLASVGQLAAGVAHEIGNPLAAILGYVDILRAELTSAGTLSPDERRDALERVKAETQRINRIIRDLLEYSRPGHEEVTRTDPLRVLSSAQALLSPQARFREVDVVRQPAEGPWPFVLASAGRLTQVLVNLLLNAADAMDGRGKVVVSCSADGQRVRLTVADEGPGIPDELQRKIFDPFFTTKAPGRGTGLGLSISRAIVESLGGTLELDTQASRGARFVIDLQRGD